MSPFLLREEIRMLREKCQDQSIPDLYRELSDLLLKAGKIPAAMNLLEHSFSGMDGIEGPFQEARISEKRDEGYSWFLRGLEYADACLYEEARSCLNHAIAEGCETFETHYCLAGVHKSLGRLVEAESHCRISLHYNPNFPPAFILLGSIVKIRGCLGECVAAIQKALLLDPDSAPAHYDLACYRALAGETATAIESLEEAVAKGFRDFEWMRRDPDLNTLRELPAFDILQQAFFPKKN